MHILLKKQKRYWHPTTEVNVEDTFVVENDILSIDAGNFACVKLTVNDTVQCSWWNSSDDEFMNCTIAAIEEDILIVEAPTGIKSKANAKDIRIADKALRGKFIPIEDGFKYCAPKMLRDINRVRAEEQKDKDAIKEAERKRKEEEQRKIDEAKRLEEQKRQALLAEEKAKKQRTQLIILSSFGAVALAAASFGGYLLVANPYFKIEEQHQGYFYPHVERFDTEKALTVLLKEGSGVEFTKEIYQDYFESNLLKGHYGTLHVQANTLVLPSGDIYSFVKSKSSKTSENTYELQTDTFEVIDEGIFFDDTYRVHCEGMLVVEPNSVSFTSKPYVLNDISTFGSDQCMHTYTEFVSEEANFQTAKENFEQFKQLNQTPVTLSSSHQGKFYVDGKYKGKVKTDQLPIRVGNKTEYFTDIKLAENKGYTDYVITSATLNGKKCVGTLDKYYDDLKVSYRCSDDTDFSSYRLTNKYKP